MTSWHIRGVVLPGQEPRDLWIADGVIVDGPVSDAQTVTDCWVMPGLVDAHCHIGLGAEGAVPPQVAQAQALADRNAGVLLVRDCGVPSDTRWIDDRADLPRIVRAGQHIARTKRYIRHLGIELEPDQLVDEVRRQAKRGDGWVKLVGDWIDRSVGDLAPSFPAEVAAQAVAAAHEEGVRMTAHCFGEQSVAELVAAGIDCIEHGTGLSDDVIEQMAARGTALVPTMCNLDNFPLYAFEGEAKFPVYTAHMKDLFARHHATLGKAREAGVPIYCGTDAGTVVTHGRAPSEVEHLGRIGDADFALGAATWRARAWLGAGCLDVGDSADLVVYPADPREDLRVVCGPSLVILRGQIVVGGR
ncbi:MAG: amidohydrolase family protein [Propionibacteriaceae bacterium]|nr:amidohydrolase family protein [Propionibacteriaceae bacterium]